MKHDVKLTCKILKFTDQQNHVVKSTDVRILKEFTQ